MSSDRPLSVIDFSAWSSEGSPEERSKVAHALVEAFHRQGFVYLANHGIGDDLVKDAFRWSKDFFDLPFEKKAEVGRDQSTAIFRGYNAPGLQRVPLTLRKRGGDPSVSGFSPDWNETFDSGSDESTKQPNKWLPEHELPGFRQFCETFRRAMWQTTQNVLRALAIGLETKDEDTILQYHSYEENNFSFKHYPSVPASELRSHEKERLGSHSDLGSITLLFQDDVGGLEVEKQNKRGSFVPIVPVPGTVVVNIGDVLMRWSNDYLLSAVHRVQPPLPEGHAREDEATRERFSIVYFVIPEFDTTVECLPGCFDEANPAKYPPRSFKDLLADYAGLFYPDRKSLKDD